MGKVRRIMSAGGAFNLLRQEYLEHLEGSAKGSLEVVNVRCRSSSRSVEAVVHNAYCGRCRAYLAALLWDKGSPLNREGATLKPTPLELAIDRAVYEQEVNGRGTERDQPSK